MFKDLEYIICKGGLMSKEERQYISTYNDWILMIELIDDPISEWVTAYTKTLNNDLQKIIKYTENFVSDSIIAHEI